MLYWKYIFLVILYLNDWNFFVLFLKLKLEKCMFMNNNKYKLE